MAKVDWDLYFMQVAQVAASRSSCSRRQVGAVVVNFERQILSTGYNGTPRHMVDCNLGGCERCASEAPSGEGLERCLCVHAEANVVAQAARSGIRLGICSTLYTTHSPCLDCSKLLVNAGVEEVVYDSEYPMDPWAREQFERRIILRAL